MSLLNEALRKRNKELDQGKKGNFFRSEQKSPWTRKIKIYGSVLLILLASGTILAIWQIYFPTRSSSRQQHIAKRTSVPLEQGALLNKITHSLASDIEQVREDKDESQGQAIIAKGLNQKKTEAVKTHSGKEKPPGTNLEKKNKRLRVKKEIEKQQEPRPQSKPEPILSRRPDIPFYRKAISYHRRGELQKAIRMYLEVLKNRPDHRDALFNLASAYIETSSFSEAYPLLQRLRDRDPDDPQVLLNSAITEIGLGRPHGALSHLKRAGFLNAPGFAVYLHRGIALSQLGKLDKAIIWYKRAEEIHPNQPFCFSTWPWPMINGKSMRRLSDITGNL